VTGHSLGGFNAIFLAAFDDRLRVIVANGSVSAWYEKHQPQHWALDDTNGGANCFIKRLRPLLTAERWRDIPVQWPEILALMTPRPFLNIQAGIPPHDDAASHWRHYGGNHAGCRAIYRLLGCEDRVEHLRTTSGHSFPPAARRLMVEWFRRHL
jgi:hypothetical protein